MNQKLKKMRQAAGLTQSQFAEKADMNIRTLQHYEQGSKDFDHARIDTILKVCLVLNCTLEDIIENTEYLEMLKKVNKKSLD